MNDGDDLAVFVYGSLVPGGSNWARCCEGKVVENRPARVRGRVYQQRDGFLALSVEGGKLRWIDGWILVLRDDAVLRDFDRLEGFEASRSAEQNDYQRVRVPCFAAAMENADDSVPPVLLGDAWAYAMTVEQLVRTGAVEIYSVPRT